MKLLTNERRALASSIAEEVNSYRRKEYNKLYDKAEKEFYRTPKGKAYKKLEDIDKSLVYPARFKTLVKESIGLPSYHQNVSHEKVETAIILAQISSKDVKSMVKEITKTLKEE